MTALALLNSSGQKSLVAWFLKHQRSLPWRENRDPYRIWISETMLQQTTSTAVKPFFERFLARFPDLKSLAEADQQGVYEVWAGLGYYSRARNLLKAAQHIYAAGGFPKTFEELIQYPGLGPYTARAVASLAFGQKVGVIDGNVIRVLSRIGNQQIEWWKPKERQILQSQADELNRLQDPYLMNQALMELGATVCLPKNPVCLICPVHTQCQAFKAQTIHLLPLRKPKKENEIWVWEPVVISKKGRLAFVKDKELPFLKSHWVLPGRAKRIKTKPKTYDFKHNITHHEIYVTLTPAQSKILEPSVLLKDQKEILWLSLPEVQGQIPASLIKKALAQWKTSQTK